MQKRHHFFRQPNFFRDCSPTVRTPLVRNKCSCVDLVMQKLRGLGQNMSQLRRQKQPLPFHTEASRNLASSNLQKRMVFLYSLRRKSHEPIRTDHRFSENKFSTLVHLRYILHSLSALENNLCNLHGHDF